MENLLKTQSKNQPFSFRDSYQFSMCFLFSWSVKTSNMAENQLKLNLDLYLLLTLKRYTYSVNKWFSSYFTKQPILAKHKFIRQENMDSWECGQNN